MVYICPNCGLYLYQSTIGVVPKHDCKFGPGDPVAHPDHYKAGKYECIEVIKALGLGYLAGCAFKYLWRYQFKGRPLEDLRKCRTYIDHLIREYEEEPSGVHEEGDR